MEQRRLADFYLCIMSRPIIILMHLYEQHSLAFVSLDPIRYHQFSLTFYIHLYREFEVRLYPEADLFTKNSVVETDGGTIDFHRGLSYDGHIVGV